MFCLLKNLLIIVSLILNSFIFIDTDKNLQNVFLRKTSEISNNNDKSKIAHIFEACWMSKGGEEETKFGQ